MQTEDTALKGVKTLRPKRVNDIRGYFKKVGVRRAWKRPASSSILCKRTRASRSSGTVRGPHIQGRRRLRPALSRAHWGGVRCSRRRAARVADLWSLLA